MTTADLSCVYDAVASLHRYERKGNTWRNRQELLIEVLTVQKSQFGRDYFIGVGLYVRALGDLMSPREEQCHVRTRLDLLMDEVQLGELRECLSFDGERHEDTRRRAVISAAISDHAVPLFERCATVGGLRQEVAVAASRRHVLVTGTLKGWLESTAS